MKQPLIQIQPTGVTPSAPFLTYEVSVWCLNCGARYFAIVQKGHRVHPLLKREKCPTCEIYGTLTV